MFSGGCHHESEPVRLRYGVGVEKHDPWRSIRKLDRLVVCSGKTEVLCIVHIAYPRVFAQARNLLLCGYPIVDNDNFESLLRLSPERIEASEQVIPCIPGNDDYRTFGRME